MEKIVQEGLLYDYYGAMLTDHQRKVYEMAVYEDMSLNEIAQNTGVSKQAVHDLIRRTTAQMQDYEDKLHLVEKSRKLKELAGEIAFIGKSLEELIETPGESGLGTRLEEISKRLREESL